MTRLTRQPRSNGRNIPWHHRQLGHPERPVGHHHQRPLVRLLPAGKAGLDKGGEIIGLALYQEKVEIKLSGLVAKTSPFNGKIGAALALANAIPAHLQATGGTTILMQISRSLNNEDFEKIDITAIHYPFVTIAAA